MVQWKYEWTLHAFNSGRTITVIDRLPKRQVCCRPSLCKLHACVRARSPITRHWTVLPTAAMADLSLSHSLQEQFLQDVRSELVQGLAMERVAKDVLEWLKTREVINAVECENVIAAGSTHHQAEALVSLLMAKPVKEIWLPVWNGLQRYSPHVHAKLHARIASQLGPTALIGMFEYRRAVSNMKERKKERKLSYHILSWYKQNFTPPQNYCPSVLWNKCMATPEADRIVDLNDPNKMRKWKKAHLAEDHNDNFSPAMLYNIKKNHFFIVLWFS